MEQGYKLICTIMFFKYSQHFVRTFDLVIGSLILLSVPKVCPTDLGSVNLLKICKLGVYFTGHFALKELKKCFYFS